MSRGRDANVCVRSVPGTFPLIPKNQGELSVDSRPQQLAPEQPTSPVETPSDVALGYDESWLSSLLRPLLIFVLVLCINIALSILLEQYAAGLGAGVRWAILGLGVVAAVIGVTSTTWLAHPNQRLRRTAGYRIAEIVLILLVSRVVLWLAQGHLPSLDAFLLSPDEVFLDGPYLLMLIALLFTWFAAIDFTDDLAQLGAAARRTARGADLRGSGMFDSSRPVQGDRRAILRRIVARWVGLGHRLDLYRFGFAHGCHTRTVLDPCAPGRASAGDLPSSSSTSCAGCCC